MAWFMRFDNGFIVAKEETTYGTDESPGAADIIITRNIQCTPLQMDNYERMVNKPGLGHEPIYYTAKRFAISFEVEFAGAGGLVNDAPAWADLVTSCCAESTDNTTQFVFTPKTNNQNAASSDSLTIYFYMGGKKYIGTGMRGNCEVIQKAGERSYLKFTMIGRFGSIASGSAPTIDWDGTDFQQAVVWNSDTQVQFTCGVALSGYSTVLYEHYLNFGNELKFRDIPGSRDVLVLGQKPTGRIVIESSAGGGIAQAFSDWENSTIFDIIPHHVKLADDGSSPTDGTVIGVATGTAVMASGVATRMQITNVQEGDRDGIDVVTIDYNFMQDEDLTEAPFCIYTA